MAIALMYSKKHTNNSRYNNAIMLLQARGYTNEYVLNLTVSEFEKVLLQTLTTYIVEESENGERQRRN